MKSFIITFCLAISTALMACAAPKEGKDIKGDGNIITKEIAISSSFNGISLEKGSRLFSSGNIISLIKNKRNNNVSPCFYYKQGNETILTITTDQNILPCIKTKIENGVLKIFTENDCNIYPSQLVIRGTSPELKQASISGGWNFYLDSPFKSEEFTATVTGGGDMYFENQAVISSCNIRITGGGDMKASSLSCDYLKAKVSGGGDLDLTGEADHGNIQISGGGDIRAYNMKIYRLDCHVSGGGTAKVNVVDYLDAKVTGGGDLYYKGEPRANTSASGGGEVHKVK